jgi:hypothetical protein
MPAHRPTFSPDGKLLLHAQGNVIAVWDASTGRTVNTLRGHVDPVVGFGVRAGGGGVWSVEGDGTFKEWDARPAGPRTLTIGEWNPLDSPPAAVSPDGGTVATLAIGLVPPSGRRSRPSPCRCGTPRPGRGRGRWYPRRGNWAAAWKTGWPSVPEGGSR